MEIIERDIERAKMLVKKGVPGAKQNLDILLKYKEQHPEQKTVSLTNIGPWKALNPDSTPIPDKHAIYETLKNEQLLKMDLKK